MPISVPSERKGSSIDNMKDTPFYESMPTEPEVVLADLLHIFHPDLLPDHTPVYYARLKISCTNETFHYFSDVAHRSVYPGPDVLNLVVRVGVYPVEVCLEHYLRTGRRAGDLAEYRLEITSSAGIDSFGGGSGPGDKRLADADCFPESTGGTFCAGDQLRCEHGRGLCGTAER